MSKINQLNKYKEHLEDRYAKLLEIATDYKYEDEFKSDRSAFKAMKVLEKLNRVRYLNQDFSNTAM